MKSGVEYIKEKSSCLVKSKAEKLRTLLTNDEDISYFFRKRNEKEALVRVPNQANDVLLKEETKNKEPKISVDHQIAKSIEGFRIQFQEKIGYH